MLNNRNGVLDNFSQSNLSMPRYLFAETSQIFKETVGTSSSFQTELDDLSEPLQEAFAPYLQNEVIRRQVEERIAHFQVT